MAPQDTVDAITASIGGLDDTALESTALPQRGRGEQAKVSVRGTAGPPAPGEYDLHGLFSGLAQQLIGHCWEVMQRDGVAPDHSDPVLEFYRHVRDGCFHANRFEFLPDQPSHTARWEGLVITDKLQGRRVFRASLQERDYFLNYGDALLLLGDASLRAYGIPP